MFDRVLAGDSAPCTLGHLHGRSYYAFVNMDEIVLQPTSDLRPKAEDVRSLGDDLSRELGFPVRLVGEPKHLGRGVTWWEVVHVWLPASAVGGAGVGKAVDVFVDWARARMRRFLDERKTKKKPNPPPQHVTIYGPDGKPLKSVTLKNPDGEPEIGEPDETDPDLPVP